MTPQELQAWKDRREEKRVRLKKRIEDDKVKLQQELIDQKRKENILKIMLRRLYFQFANQTWRLHEQDITRYIKVY